MLDQDPDYQLGYLTKAVTDLAATMDKGMTELRTDMQGLQVKVVAIESQISMAKTAVWAVKWTVSGLVATLLFFIGPLDSAYKWFKALFTT